MGVRNRGFTLIELLIVIAIILILIAIALPNFLEAQIRAKLTRNYSEFKSIAVALEMYRGDYREYPGNNRWTRGAKDELLSRYFELTTPTAYLKMIPVDPFGPEEWEYPVKHGSYIFCGDGGSRWPAAGECVSWEPGTWWGRVPIHSMAMVSGLQSSASPKPPAWDLSIPRPMGLSATAILSAGGLPEMTRRKILLDTVPIRYDKISHKFRFWTETIDRVSLFPERSGDEEITGSLILHNSTIAWSEAIGRTPWEMHCSQACQPHSRVIKQQRRLINNERSPAGHHHCPFGSSGGIPRSGRNSGFRCGQKFLKCASRQSS
ncbi:prepilin-type N-terminal cleavage/methylation domain-containing protein [bacterium]|nr:prepilin-type N-terminal cleavage/methylation domain-containing protein [bacterium]